jgi:rod shape-determining protein MreD
MKTVYFKEVLLFLLLIILQVLLLNRINVFGIATPVLYIYFLLKLSIGRNQFYVIISGFLLGLIIDIFLNTPGVCKLTYATAEKISCVSLLKVPF